MANTRAAPARLSENIPEVEAWLLAAVRRRLRES
jgi:hypothetical protein